MKILRFLLFSSSAAFLFLSCSPSQTFAKIVDKDPIGYYLVGKAENRREMKNFLIQLEQNQDNYEHSFVLLQQIMRNLYEAGEKEKLNLLLTTYTENHPSDPFNGYYLLIVANNYLEAGAYPFATHYFEQILRNHNDLLVQDQSIHYLCLMNLTRMVDAPAPRAEYYKELIARFGEGQRESSPATAVDMGLSYYNLAKTYEELGEWDLSYQAYRNFLQYPDAAVPGVSDVHRLVREKVAFHDYRNKNWLDPSLENLKNNIQGAIIARSSARLRRHWAKVNFFTQYWEQQSPITEREVEDFLNNLDIFMVRRITMAGELDRDSNAQEAYLETHGWSYRIPAWYLYFNRVSYPADPEINGQWQWAGIYFGEKPFSGTNRL